MTISCCNDPRRDAVRRFQGRVGLDFVEVSADQRTLFVYFLGKLPPELVQDRLELVRHLRIEGGSTVASLALKDDSFKVYIDAFIRGARVTNVAQREDGTYETTVEMDFDANAARSQAQARLTAPPGARSAHAMVGSAGPGASYGASFYHAQ